MQKYFVLALLAALVGCGASDVDVTTAQTKMTVLARIDRSPTDVITFLDSPYGIIISEKGRAEEAGNHAPLDSLRAQGIAATYRALSSDHDAEVPKALLAAESRWASRSSAQARSAPPKVVEPPAARQQLGATAKPLATRGEVGKEQSALGGLPTDSAWWQNLPVCQYSDFDGAGRTVGWYDGVWCVTDVTWAQTGWRDTMYYEVTGFGQGSAANVTVNKWIDGSWQVVLSETIDYRYYQTFSFAPENGAYFYSRVDGTDGQNIGIAERFRLAMPWPSFQNNNPSGASYEFANDIQGITHDSDNWYLTRTKYGCVSILCDEFESKYGILAKVPLSTSLSNDISNDHGEPQSWNQAPGGYSLYTHYGDLVYLGGRVYVGMDGPNAGAAIGIFDSDLNPLNYVTLDQNWTAPAVAFNPMDGLFYVPSDSTTFQKYEMDGTTSANYRGSFTLSEPLNGGVQGAKFSQKGNLWVLVNGAYYGIDGANGAVLIAGGINMGDTDEGEGLDIFDLDSEWRPGMSGQLHFQLLENNLSDDSWWFMHWSAPMDRL